MSNVPFLIWLAWALTSALAIRTVFLRWVSPRVSQRGHRTIANLGCLGIFLLGLFAVDWTGVPMYGFDSHNWRHQLGYFLLVFAPWGLPLLVGMPFVFLFDLSVVLRGMLTVRRR